MKTEIIEKKYKAISDVLVNFVEPIKRTGLTITALGDRYARFKMPLKGNANHIGCMYAGSLFILGEFTGGVIPAVAFDLTKYYPIVKEIKIEYLSMAKTDVTLEVEISEEQVRQVESETRENGKADFILRLELKDDSGETVSIVNGIWQMRTIPEELAGMAEMIKSLQSEGES